MAARCNAAWPPYARPVGGALPWPRTVGIPIQVGTGELTEPERAVTDLNAINDAVQRQYFALSSNAALAFWRAMHIQASDEVARLTDGRLAAPGTSAPPTTWANLRGLLP